jgi:glutamyl-tRNA reductase
VDKQINKQVIIVGLSHRTAPIDVREAAAFDVPDIKHALTELLAAGSLQEAAIVSTCNRVEVVAATVTAAAGFSDIRTFLAGRSGLRSPNGFDHHLYTYEDRAAVRHLFRVAASLDSMVVGEPQILGQLKAAYDIARQSGAAGTVLHRLFHRSFSVGKRVRTETGIASGAVSVSSVAMDLAKRIFDRFDDKTAMLIGAGKMAGLMAPYLQRHGIQSLMVTNRTFDRAVELAGKIHGSPILFEDFPRYLKMADLVIGCAGSAEILIDAATVERVLKERKHQPMFFIDIGDRRNFEPRINEIDNAYLYNIDDLKAVAEENRQERSQEADRAESIIDEEVQGFIQWFDSLEQVPTITALRDRLENIRRREIEKSLNGNLKDLTERQRQAVDDMTCAMIKKILHGPLTRLKRNSDGGDDTLYVAALKKLFDLEREE